MNNKRWLPQASLTKSGLVASFVIQLHVLHQLLTTPSHQLVATVLRNVYNMSGRSVSVYTDTSASHEYLCTLIQNGQEFCKLLIKRPQTVMFSNFNLFFKCLKTVEK